MRTSIKITVVFIMVLSLAGCATSRKKKSREAPEEAISSMDYNSTVAYIKAFNITTDGFYIRKGKIDLIDGTPVEGEYGFTAKLNNEGDFYASVKGPLGIELVRFLAVENDICAIVKLTKTVYIGKKDKILKEYGLPEDFFTAIFGDMPDITSEDTDSIAGNKLLIKKVNDKLERLITICMDEMKVCSEEVFSIKENKTVSLIFGNFMQAGDRKYASEIEVRQIGDDFHMKLYIETLEPGCSDKIEFNVPSYKSENL